MPWHWFARDADRVPEAGVGLAEPRLLRGGVSDVHNVKPLENGGRLGEEGSVYRQRGEQRERGGENGWG